MTNTNNDREIRSNNVSIEKINDYRTQDKNVNGQSKPNRRNIEKGPIELGLVLQNKTYDLQRKYSSTFDQSVL